MSLATAPAPSPKVSVSKKSTRVGPNNGPAATRRNAEFGKRLAMESDVMASDRLFVKNELVERGLEVPSRLTQTVRIDCRDREATILLEAIAVGQEQVRFYDELTLLNDSTPMHIVTSLQPEVRALLADPAEHLAPSASTLKWASIQVDFIKKRMTQAGGRSMVSTKAPVPSTGTPKPKAVRPGSASKRKIPSGLDPVARAAAKASLTAARKAGKRSAASAQPKSKDKKSKDKPAATTDASGTKPPKSKK